MSHHTATPLPGMRDHPQRRVLNDELHARLAEPLAVPLRLTHLMMLSGERGAQSDRDHVASLCRKYDATPPAAGAMHHAIDLGEFRLRWERHTECSTYTFFRPGAGRRVFADPAIEALPSDWINRLPGERLVAIQLEVEAEDGADGPPPGFGQTGLVGSRIAGGRARVWTDFRIRGDGYTRMLVHAGAMGANELGQQVRRLLEIESYRMLALLALPVIKRVGPRLGELERRLADITADMQEHRDVSEADEQRYLARLTGLAAETEHIAAQSNYRIAAARAYHALVERRLDLLDEAPLSDLEPIGSYLRHRMQPAADTCEAVRRRIDDVAERIGRANGLLRTRLDVKQATQSRDLLDSMDRRAGMQLRLEQAVEVITVIAGAYYLSGLLKQAGKAIVHAVPGWSALPVESIVGFATPVLVLGLWLLVHHFRSRAHRGDMAEEESHPR